MLARFPCPDPAPINSFPNALSGLRPDHPPKAKVLQPMCIVQDFVIQGIVQFDFKYATHSD
jgi:hypothetical protein